MDDTEVARERDIPRIEPNVLKAKETRPQPVVTCAQCQFWNEKSVGFGDCMQSAKYGAGPILTTDRMSCSEGKFAG